MLSESQYLFVGDDINLEREGDFHSLLPPLYDDVMELSLYPKDETGAFVVEVWDYLQRMSLYKYLIEHTPHCLYDSEAHDMDRNNILWGLPLQHGWQFESGRLLTSNNDTNISSDSWWGAMNYYLSVIPYFGAVDAGLAPMISIKYNPDPTIFCDSPSFCYDDVKPWKKFFLHANATKDSCSENNEDAKLKVNINTPIADAIDFNLTHGMESLLSLLWSAHLHSIDSALPKFSSKLLLLPEPEQTFGSAWATIVDFIAATFFPCDLPTTDILQKLLPPRLLQDGDQVPFISDFSRLQNRAVLFIDGLDMINTASNYHAESWWRHRAMCTERERALGREMITLGVYRPSIAVEDMKLLLKELWDSDRSHSSLSIC